VSHYNDALNDDAADPHVIDARTAGRAWADREWDTCNQTDQRGQSWFHNDSDALPLVRFAPNSDVDAQEERERELATIANVAASERWDVFAGDNS
jgi:hypothetical protein